MPRFERVDHRGQQLDGTARQIKPAVNIQEVIRRADLYDSGVAGARIRSQGAQNVSRADFGQRGSDQHNLRLRGLQAAKDSMSIGCLPDNKAGFDKRSRENVSSPDVVVCDQHLDALVSAHNLTCRL
jgi:hypothetical protein